MTALTASFTPNLGWANLDDMFDPDLNGLLIEIALSDMIDASLLSIPVTKTPETLIFGVGPVGVDMAEILQVPTSDVRKFFQSGQTGWIMRYTNVDNVASDPQFFTLLTKL